MQRVNYLFSLIAGSILVIFIFFFRTEHIANIDSQGKNIICFGDSLTFGYDVAENESYPNVLSRMLGIPVINAGRNGDTTKTALARLESDVLDKEPLLVIVILGANDFFADVPKEQTFNNLRVILRNIKSKGAMVVLGQLGPFGMHGYRRYFKKLAGEEKVLLIKDVMSGIFAHPDLMIDHIHPNPKGYEKLAQKVYRTISPIIRKIKN